MLSLCFIGCANKNNPKNPENVFMDIGNNAKASKNIPLAIQAYKNAHIAAPEKIEAPLALGDISQDIGSYAKAEKYYNQVLEIDNKSEKALLSLARNKILLKKYDSAISSYQRIPASDHNINVLSNLGILLDLAGLHENAQDCYRKGLAQDKNNTVLANNLAISLLNDDKLNEAHSYLKAAAAIPKSHKIISKNLDLIEDYLYSLQGEVSDSDKEKLKTDLTKKINNNQERIVLSKDSIFVSKKLCAMPNVNEKITRV